MTAPAQDVTIPYCPRVWARPAHASLRRWAVLVLHRRAGKTTFELNHHQRAAMDDAWERRRLRSLLPHAPASELETLLRKRIYWHVMPTYKQAKVTAWEMLKDFARPIPGVAFNESELLVKYPNGSRIQLIGADHPDGLRGPGLSGLSLDEFSQHPPNIFGEILSKALADHLGYCLWSGTIKGHDQLYRLHDEVRADPDWFALWQNIDTSLETESGATITALTRAMEDDRKLVLQHVMTQAEYDQEWYLSPEAAIKGAIYATQLGEARAQGRVTVVPYDPALPVDTVWDLGVGDATAIWFVQSLRTAEIRLIDYYEASGEGLPHYAKVLQDRPYAYGTHTAPFDIQVKELGSGRTRLETARALGISFRIAPALSLEDGIHAARLLWPRCWVDREKCAVGLEALAHYRRSYNTRLHEFTATPVHDVYSHGADAFRYLAISQRTPRDPMPRQGTPRPPPHRSGRMSWAG